MPEEEDDEEENGDSGEKPDEEVPAPLRDKWFREELSFRETVTCPVCRREVPRETITCVFCGAQVFEKSGLLGTILALFRKLFR